ncbi:MAG TPA: heavy metal-associated domain-containing protein, partial [Symbiobacteriaceae bacterium]|nr:heavy metal-associated domain-containing protein [Symbiobacteriaceae bacterium]
MDCAAKFERDVAAIPGVTRVELNFAAAKVTVEGNANREAVAAAGKGHNISVRPEREASPALPFWRANPH